MGTRLLAGRLFSEGYSWDGKDPAFGVVIAFAGGFLLVGAVTTLLSEGGGPAKSTPVKREYSYPESLAARGRYEDAIDGYQVCCADYPEDPEPYVRIARLYRDHFEMYDEALFWVKRARSESALNSGRELLITQEIIEVYTCRIGQPRKAIPELASLGARA
jgi:tetratricopeptide (TPR) repeat protein